MIRRNMGRLDRTLRFIVGVALIPVGLFALGGWQGNAIGTVVAAVALLPLVTSLTGSVPVMSPLASPPPAEGTARPLVESLPIRDT